jgi:hypothetical protein
MKAPGTSQLVTIWIVIFLGLAQSVRGAGEYIYGIGSDWSLYQITVDPTAATVSVKKETLNLTGYISGWGTHNNEVLNGLGIDPATGDLYFNYSYNDSVSSTAGTQSVVPYIYQQLNGSYRTPYALGAAITSAVLPASDVSAGWLPRATYHNGTYYAGMQVNDTFVALPISGTTTKSYSTVTKYTDWDHTTATTSMSGGDFVIGTNEVIYGATTISSANQFFRQQLSNATNAASGGAWTNFNIDASIPYATQGSIQVAGLGQSTNLYVASSSGQNLYLVNGYNGASTPTFTQIGGSAALGVTFTDLSIAFASALPIPESDPRRRAMYCLGLVAALERVRRSRRWKSLRRRGRLAGWFRRVRRPGTLGDRENP